MTDSIHNSLTVAQVMANSVLKASFMLKSIWVRNVLSQLWLIQEIPFSVMLDFFVIFTISHTMICCLNVSLNYILCTSCVYMICMHFYDVCLVYSRSKTVILFSNLDKPRWPRGARSIMMIILYCSLRLL